MLTSPNSDIILLFILVSKVLIWQTNSQTIILPLRFLKNSKLEIGGSTAPLF